MKILSMTATFGKLEGQTLTLNPGLNVIHAPNEWGKSTWCAFLIAMLYGIETRERTTAKTIAEKERFAPWSGKPMSGRMDILWDDRKITLERSTKGRSVFGHFRAYETDTGLPVPELTAENCGLVLLGVEKTVFTRTGFLKLTDLPVTDDLALRRRLNELVTTGDESGASDMLAQKLKDLKNRCRHNKTGLLPQAEAQRDILKSKLDALSSAREQCDRIRQRQEDLQKQIQQLENHKAVLDYSAAKENLQRVANAQAAHTVAVERIRELEAQCEALPGADFSRKKLEQAEALQTRWTRLQSYCLPRIPEAPAPFTGLDGSQSVAQAQKDKAAYDQHNAPSSPLFWILAAVCFAVCIGLSLIHPVFGLPFLLLAGVCIFLHFRKESSRKQALARLCARYGALAPDLWLSTAQQYATARATYEQDAAAYNADKAALSEATEMLTGAQPLDSFIRLHRQHLARWQTLSEARQSAAQAARHAEALAAVVTDVPAPQGEDNLTLTAEQTHYQLNEAAREQQLLQMRLGQYMGQAESMGSEEALTQQLQAVLARIRQLEDTYAALTIAQETLAEAANELQRRFAPRIAARARELFEHLTGGRYDRLFLESDLSLQVAARNEDTLHTAPWRSDGTIDQLYLALRSAVAEALTPDAPLVLDDALVRFDDDRLALAMTLLKEVAAEKQVILFTCQRRETEYV